jgi:hypothetical protein
MSVTIPASIGELWDKFSILTIKLEQIQDESKRKRVEQEKEMLMSSMEGYCDHPLWIRLKETNQILWTIEDRIRQKERDQAFDQEFIQLARSVYLVNDKRAEIKAHINREFDSILVEVKDYVSYHER